MAQGGLARRPARGRHGARAAAQKGAGRTALRDAPLRGCRRDSRGTADRLPRNPPQIAREGLCLFRNQVRVDRGGRYLRAFAQEKRTQGPRRRQDDGVYRPQGRRLRRARKLRHRQVHGNRAPFERGHVQGFSAHPVSGERQALRPRRPDGQDPEIHRLGGRSAQDEPPFGRRVAEAEGARQGVHSGDRRRTGEAVRLQNQGNGLCLFARYAVAAAV